MIAYDLVLCCMRVIAFALFVFSLSLLVKKTDSIDPIKSNGSKMACSRACVHGFRRTMKKSKDISPPSSTSTEQREWQNLTWGRTRTSSSTLKYQITLAFDSSRLLLLFLASKQHQEDYEMMHGWGFSGGGYGAGGYANTRRFEEQYQ